MGNFYVVVFYLFEEFEEDFFWLFVIIDVMMNIELGLLDIFLKKIMI